MAANNAVVMQAQNQMGVNVQSFQAKYNSKRECYNFLAWEVKAYLPAYETVTIYFLKDVISGRKKCKYGCMASHFLSHEQFIFSYSILTHPSQHLLQLLLQNSIEGAFTIACSFKPGWNSQISKYICWKISMKCTWMEITNICLKYNFGSKYLYSE